MVFPKPDFSRPNYSAPSAYVGLDPSFAGHSGRVDQLVATFAARDPEQRLAEIATWISTNLTCENDTSQYFWRNADDVIDRGKYIGCADHALVFGCLARASSIPIIWVKSLDRKWIRDYREKKQWDGGKGHVFLEVHLNGSWALLDAQSTALDLYECYDVGQQLLPGDRFAYDKGGNPRKLLLSIDSEPWIRQTKAYFQDFDLTELDAAKAAIQGEPRRLLSNTRLQQSGA